MKPLIFIALTLLAFSNNINAQSYTERVSMQKDFFMLKMNEQEFWTIHRNNIVRYTSDGDTISNVPVNFPNNYVNTFYAEFIDSQTIKLFVVLGTMTDMPTLQSMNAFTINADGIILDNKIILDNETIENVIDPDSYFSFPFNTVKSAENKYLIQLNNGWLICFDEELNVLWYNQFNNPSLMMGYNSRVYLTFQNEYHEIDLNGTILNIHPVNISGAVEIEDGLFIRAGYNSVEIFNNAGVTLYANTEISRLNYLGRKDSLIILSSSKFFNAVAASDSSFIYILNDQLELLYTYQFNNPRSMRSVDGLMSGNFMAFENHFITKINQEHIVVGWMDYMYSYGFKSFGYNLQEVNHSKDVGVIGINCSDFNIIPQGGSNPLPYQVSANCSVLIKNFSQDTISNFFINYYEYPGVAHGCACFSWYVDTVTLAPNEEKIIAINQTLFKGYFFNLPTSVRYCLCTTTPNGFIDSDYTNDFHCETFQITNINELESHNQIIIFPNPGNGTYQILDENMRFKYPLILEVYNMQGAKILQEKKNSNSIGFQIDAASGLYFVSLIDETGKQFRTRLIHKQL